MESGWIKLCLKVVEKDMANLGLVFDKAKQLERKLGPS